MNVLRPQLLCVVKKKRGNRVAPFLALHFAGDSIRLVLLAAELCRWLLELSEAASASFLTHMRNFPVVLGPSPFC